MTTATIGYDLVRPARPRLRLTKRGRAVLATLAAAPLAVAAFLFVLNGGTAAASLEGASTEFTSVTMESGQSLWSLAESIAPDADPRDVIARLMAFNQLTSPEVGAGQQLAIPTEYAGR